MLALSTFDHAAQVSDWQPSRRKFKRTASEAAGNAGAGMVAESSWTLQIRPHASTVGAATTRTTAPESGRGHPGPRPRGPVCPGTGTGRPSPICPGAGGLPRPRPRPRFVRNRGLSPVPFPDLLNRGPGCLVPWYIHVVPRFGNLNTRRRVSGGVVQAGRVLRTHRVIASERDDVQGYFGHAQS